MNENLGCNFYLATHPKLPVCTFNCSKLCEKLNKLHAAIIEINL